MITRIRTLAAMLCVLLSFALHGQPVVSSLSAYSGLPGSSITISGGGFDATPANNVVMFGATRGTVTAASATSLTVTVPSGATMHVVSVLNSTSGLKGSSNQLFLPSFPSSAVYAGQYSYNNEVTVYDTNVQLFYSLPTRTLFDPVLADLNGDSKPEILNIAMGEWEETATLFITINNCVPGNIDKSMLRDSIQISLDAAALSIYDGYNALMLGMEVEDVDNDGRPDIVIAYGSAGIAIFRNISVPGIPLTSASFAAPYIIPTGSPVIQFAFGDLNADGKNDLSATTIEGQQISIFQNNSTPGSISFGPEALLEYPYLYWYNPTCIEVIDIDQDGKVDVVTGGTIWHHVGSASAMDTSAFEPSVGYADPDFRLADFDGDGKLDITASSSVYGYLFRNKTSPGVLDDYSFPFYYPISYLPDGITGAGAKIADINGDGKPDIIVPNLGPSDAVGFYVLYNQCPLDSVIGAFFSTHQNNPATTVNGHFAIGDIDGDGRPEFVYSSTAVGYYNSTLPLFSILQATYPPPVVAAISSLSGAPGTSLTITGQNFDPVPANNVVLFGTSKAVVTAASSNSLTVTIPYGAKTGEISVFNTVSKLTGNYIHQFTPTYDHSAFPDGAIAFDPKLDFVLPTTSDVFHTFADLDGDNKLDLIAAYNDTLLIRKNVSTAGTITTSSFDDGFIIKLGEGAINKIIVKDIDNDGRPDIICTNFLSNVYNTYLLKNNVSGVMDNTSFVNCTPDYLSWRIRSIEDLDNDGKMDISGSARDDFWVETGLLAHNLGKANTLSVSNFDIYGSNTLNSLPNSEDGFLMDLDNDNKPDFNFNVNIAYKNDMNPGLSWEYYNNYSLYMGFLPYPIYTNTSSFNYYYYDPTDGFDLNADGKMDKLYQDYPSSDFGGVYVFPNTTAVPGVMDANTLGARVTVSESLPAYSYNYRMWTFEDFDGDGKVDYLEFGLNKIVVRRNLSSGGTIAFGAPKEFFVGFHPYAVSTGDADGDGKPDVVVSYRNEDGSNGWCILRNNPNAIVGNGTLCQGAAVTFSSASAGGTWSSSNSSVATVGSSSGVVSPLSVGTATITYTFAGGGAAYSLVTVNPVADLSATDSMSCTGGSLFKTLTFPGADTLTGAWSIANPAIASFGYAAPAIYGVGAGTTMVSYTTTVGCTSTRTFTVNTTVEGGTITGEPVPCAGTIDTFYGSPAGGTWVAYYSGYYDAYPMTPIDSVSAGLICTFPTTYPPFTVYYHTAGCHRASKAVTVIYPASSLAIGGNPSICVGFTRTFSGNIGGGTWESSNTSVATINASGLVTALSTGTATISYSVTTSCGSGSRTVIVTVNASPGDNIISGPTAVCSGGTITLANTLSGGNWTSGATAIASVGSATGIVTGAAPGTVAITYSYPSSTCGTSRSSQIVTVNGAASGSISGTTSLCTGITNTLSAPVAGGTWVSNNPSVATIGSADGTLTGVSAGSAVVSYTVYNGCTTVTLTANVIVYGYPWMPPIMNVSTVCTGSTLSLSSTTPGGTWSSGNPSVATVSETGMVTALVPGTVNISYTVTNGCGSTSGIKYVTVNPLPSAGSISGTLTLCPSGTTSLSSTASGGTWSIADASAVTVDASTGVVTGISAGTVIVSYTVSNSCGTDMATSVVTVNALPSAGTISGASTTCPGAAITLSSTSSGGIWSSSSANATVNSATGIVTGVSAGTATISYTVTNSCGTDMATKSLTINVSPFAGTVSGADSICQFSNTTFISTVSGGVWSSSSANAVVGSANGVVNGSSGGTATISYTYTNSCGSAVATKGITIKPWPAIGSVFGAGVICIGSTRTLTSNASGGTWTVHPAGIVAIDSFTGVMTTISTGTATILYYTSTSCGTIAGNADVTVNPLPSAGVISGPSTVVGGSTITLSSTGITGGYWSSSDYTTAYIDMSTGIVSGIQAGTVTISYSVTTCATSISTFTLTVTDPVAPIMGNTPICPGGTLPLTDATPGGTWDIMNPFVGSISTSGVVTGIGTGTSYVTYTVGSHRVFTIVTVNAPPSGITGASATCTSMSTTLSNTTTGGNWSSTDPGIASINSSGVVSANAAGTTTISYTLPTGCASSSLFTVGTTPSAISGPSSLCVGATATFGNSVGGGTWSSGTPTVININSTTGAATAGSSGTAVISYTLAGSCTVTFIVTVNASPGGIAGATTACTGISTTLSCTPAGGVWSSTNSSIASINTSGVVSAIVLGTTTISYTLPGGCVSSTVFTVSSGPSAISGPTYLCAGSTATFSNSGGGGTWSSSTPTVVNINSATGAATAGSSGTAVISYTVAGGCAALLSVTVATQPAVITGGTSPICNGATTTLNDATSGGSWSSSNTAVASISSSTGVVTGTGAGTATIYYTIGSGCSRSITVTINATPASIAGTLSVCPGSTTLLSDPTSPGTSWTSSTPATATINSGTGLATGVAAGTTTISYTLGTGCYITAVLTVNAAPAAIGGTLSVCQGSVTTLTDAVSGGSWTSSNTAKATIDISSGIVSGIAAGTAIISYSTGAGCVKTATVTVNAAPSAIGGTLSVCPGGTSTLSNTTTPGTWSSTTTSVATIVSSTGVATAIAIGTTTISYRTTAGCVATTILTVATAPAGSTGTQSICASGGITTLTNAISGGTWSSSNAAVASVASSGTNSALVTGGSSAGVATITYSLGGGCRATTAVTVNALPSAITGTLTACTGAVTTLNNSYNGGSWSSSDVAAGTIQQGSIQAIGLFRGLVVGTTTVSYTYTATGCARSVVVTVNASPDAGTISGATTIHIASTPTVALSSDGDAGGTWSSSNTAKATVGSATGIVTGIAAGTANITYSVTTSGCTSRSTQLMTISATRPGNSVAAAENKGVHLYPNPTQGSLHIEGRWSEDDEQVGLEISDMAGQLIWQGQSLATQGQLDVSVALPIGIANGMYMLRLRSGAQQQVFQFVVSK